MTIQEVIEGGVTVFRLSGELDLKGAPALKDRLSARVSGERPLTIVNLEQVGYIDSAGLGVLVGALKGHTAQGGKLVLAAPKPEVRHVLEITRMLQYLAVHATEADAIAALRRSS